MKSINQPGDDQSINRPLPSVICRSLSACSSHVVCRYLSLGSRHAVFLAFRSPVVSSVSHHGSLQCQQYVNLIRFNTNFDQTSTSHTTHHQSTALSFSWPFS